MAKIPAAKIRNVAVIAHVDHGKTTLVDAFLKQTNLFRANEKEMEQEAILDFNELERQKGITIKAKNASITYKDYKINIIDTPGHADFGGEVERTLNMADGCLLVVDAQEGPMPQTKIVLARAMKTGLKPIVVINKIDKEYANPKKVLDKVNDLFLELATTDEQLDFPVFYAVGREGKAFAEMPTGDIASQPGDISVLLDAIIEHIPAPTPLPGEGLQMLITTLDFDPHLGRLLVGKISRGGVSLKDNVVVLDGEKQLKGQVKSLFVRKGLAYEAVDGADAGEIAAIGGIDSNAIGSTVVDPAHLEALPKIQLTPPAVKAKFEANSSPFMGREGKFVSAKQLQQRLEQEQQINIGLEISKAETGSGYSVAGRGEMQLAILVEEMRREGYEFQVRRPEVILHEENGITVEPLEEVVIDAPAEYQGGIITEMSERKGELVSMQNEDGQAKMVYKILTRNLIGLRAELVNLTKGTVVMGNQIIGYVPYKKENVDIYRKGVIISTDTGMTAAYALNTIQERGEMFVTGSEAVYEGQIIGINKYEQDMDANPCKEREKSGVRRSSAEITQVVLRSPKPITIEYALTFINDDEMIEVTPQNIRLRKLHLKPHERVWAKRENLTDMAKAKLAT
jgi:GTP-binding protein